MKIGTFLEVSDWMIPQKSALSTEKTLTLFGKMSWQFPIGQHHFYFKEEEGWSQDQNSQRGSKAESNTGIEGTVVSWREEEIDKVVDWEHIYCI